MVSRKTILFAALLLVSLSTSCSNGQTGESVERDPESTISTSKAETPVAISFQKLRHTDRESVPPSAETTPDVIKELSGKQVVLSGFLSPCVISKKRYFVLAETPVIEPSYQPLADELAIVSLKEAWEAAKPIHRVKIRGILRIEDFFTKENERNLCVYRLDEAEMEIVR